MLLGASKNNSQKHRARMQDDASSLPFPSSPDSDYQQRPETLERKVLGVYMYPGEESNLFCFP